MAHIRPGTSPTVQAIHRLNHAERDRPQRFAWAVLGSAWVHILITLSVFLGIRCTAVTGADARSERAMAVLLVDPPSGSIPATEAPVPPTEDASTQGPQAAQAAGAGGTETSDADAVLDAEALAAMDPEDLAALDPAMLSAIDPEALAALDPELLAALDPSVLAALDPELLAALDLSTLDPAVLERLAQTDPRLLAALEARRAPRPDGLAEAPDRDTRSELPSDGVDTTADDEEAPGLDPDDAVADVALTELPEDDQPSEEDKEDDEEEPPEPEEEPEPEPEPEGSTPRFQRYLHAPEDQRTETEDADSEYISSRDLSAEELRRAEVTSDVEGETTPPLEGLPMTSGTPSMNLVNGEVTLDGGDAPAAGQPTVDPREVQPVGGGVEGGEEGLGAPTDGGGTRGGALARSGRRAAASASAVVLAGGGAPTTGVKPAPEADDRIRRQDGWWSPGVARILIQAPDVTPTVAPVTAALDVEEIDRAPVPKPDDRDDVGGTEQPVEDDEEMPDAPEPTPSEDSGEADPVEEIEEAPEPVESVSDLRASLGWGGMDDTRKPPRRNLPGIETTEGNKRTSQQSTAQELLVDRFAIVAATDSPLGRYRAELDEEIRTQWNTMDLSLHERALGIQGDVSIVFHIQSNGKVTEKTVTRSSGHASLDQMALDAVPDKLPRIPKDVDASTLFHAYTFVYRNPMIVGGDTGGE